MDLLKVTIDHIEVQVSAGSTILSAAKEAKINIPTLCHHPDQRVKANCRVCMVEVEGSYLPQPACSYPVYNGMVVRTNTQAIREIRKTVVEMILAHHPTDCLSCSQNLSCELQNLTRQLGVRESPLPRTVRGLGRDASSRAVVRDMDKCINCRRCLEVCHQIQGVGVLAPVSRGYDSVVGTPFEQPLGELACVYCGQCILACPVGAIIEQDDTQRVWEALADPDLHVVVQTAPATRVALGDELGLPTGSRATGMMVAALRQLGFDQVFDTDFTADLTIMEEGSELLKRVSEQGTLPMITSCCPGWIKFAEHNYPDLLDHLSTCKSPQQMFGALAKTYYPQKVNLDPAKVFVVSVMPCTAKKFEANRPEMADSGYPDVDVVLTTRELTQMIRTAGIDFTCLAPQEYDQPLGLSTGAAAIFGNTGGVMEAALRTVYELVTGTELEDLQFHEVRGLTGIKTSSVDLPIAEVAAGANSLAVKVAVAHGLANARILMDQIREGTADYQFIEVMCCPGGCIGGGGQPKPSTLQDRQKRLQALYSEDEGMLLRKSHHNPAVQALYEEYLESPLGEKSHHLLHTHYTPRG